MGYASYFEDIRDRLDERAGALRRALDDGSMPAAEIKRQAQSLLDAWEQTRKEFDELAELARDPHFDLAFEIAELDREKAELQREITGLEVRRVRLQSHNDRLETEGKELKREQKRLRREIAAKDEELEAFVRKNPAAALDAYSTPAHIREGKPGESSERN
jgi:chromosome segregation ATPase